MKQLLGVIIGAGLIYIGYSLRNPKEKKPRFEIKDTHDILDSIYCGDISTSPSDENDPWDYTLEPCKKKACTIRGGQALCDDHLDIYLAEMIQRRND